MKSLLSVIYLFIAELLFGKTVLSYNVDIIAWDDAVQSGIIEERIDVDTSEEIYRDRTSVTPFMWLMDNLKSKPATTTRVRGFEERSAPDIVTINGAVAKPNAGASATVVLVAGQDKYVAVNDTVKLMCYIANEAVYTAHGIVTAKPSANTLTVKPISDGTDGESALIFSKDVGGIPDQTQMFISGNAYKQSESSVTPITTVPEPIYNVTQIIRTGYELSDSAKQENVFGEDERGRLMRIAKLNHQKALEKGVMTNGKMVHIKQAGGSNPDKRGHKGYLQGLEYWLLKESTKNVVYSSTNTLYASWKNFEKGIFDPNFIDGVQYHRTLLINQEFKVFFTELAYQKVNYVDVSEEYGIPGVLRLNTPNGTFDLISHPLLNMLNPTYPYAMALHMAYLEYRPYRKTRLRTNIQNPDVDGLKDEFLTEHTYMLYLPELHGVFRRDPSL